MSSKTIFHSWTSTFLKGLFTLLPFILSIYVIMWFLGFAERTASQMILVFWPDALYLPGMGVAFVALVIYGFGVIIDKPLANYVFRMIENFLGGIPLIKTLYLSIKDFTDYFTPDKSKKNNQVVNVRIPGTDMEIVGLLTRESLMDLPDGVSKTDRVAVYLPLSYQIGGYTVFVPRSWVTPIDMSVEQVMRSVLTAWLPGRDLKVLQEESRK